ncbi:VOC family protein [Flavobacterium sp. NKUCC04_CG]|uniref:VOC family protein n=1 Tax=Flavobacterium sp. NKUCC04_CG TaxID=2842121 RepID=UPI001C5AA8CB|nr:hypothetical protein [Flavobacterium sp. NKUCC04_CG]MBW3520361.1 hypothetical protein [Flavobacterium sp. NKUCC04_CG]
MKIKTLTILTSNLRETEQFYSDKLKLTLLSKSETTLHYQVGFSTLVFTYSATKPAVYHYAFNIPASLLDSALVWASQRFNLITNPSNELITNFENWNAKAIYFYDNQGNLLELIARFDLEDRVQDLVFDQSKIGNISEIGIVTEDPITCAERWIQEHSLTYFKKTVPTKDFLALGDDEGLLILVSPNRTWYPTTIAAEKSLSKIEIKTAGTTIFLESEVTVGF